MLGEWFEKFRPSKFHSGIGFTICFTNQFHLPKNSCEGLKLVSKISFNNWSTNLRLDRLSLIFYLKSYCTRNLSTRAAKPRAARNEGVSPRRENKSPSFLVWSKSLIVIITSWFAMALDEIRTRRILREKADCKQSTV